MCICNDICNNRCICICYIYVYLRVRLSTYTVFKHSHIPYQDPQPRAHLLLALQRGVLGSLAAHLLSVVVALCYSWGSRNRLRQTSSVQRSAAVKKACMRIQLSDATNETGSEEQEREAGVRGRETEIKKEDERDCQREREKEKEDGKETRMR